MPTNEEIEFIRAATARFVQQHSEERVRPTALPIQSAPTQQSLVAPIGPAEACRRWLDYEQTRADTPRDPG